jgi:hypothetical protein
MPDDALRNIKLAEAEQDSLAFASKVLSLPFAAHDWRLIKLQKELALHIISASLKDAANEK